MSENSEQQRLELPIFRHYCKVCNRGFSCAGALGGHMRSHATGDVNILQQQQHGEDQKQHLINNNLRDKPEGNKHPYFLRNNTNRFTSYREIEDRGIKCLLDHDDQRASSEVEDQRNSICQKSRNSYYNDDNNHQHYSCASREEEDLANCLVMLSNNKSFVLSDNEEKKAKKVEKDGMFQCKACKKVFNSHQALGGHRASHKKVKGCYAARFDTINNDDHHDQGNNNNNNNLEEDFSNHDGDVSNISALEFSPDANSRPDVNTALVSRSRKAKAHECSICHRVFSSGQALGGHKRCHWLTSNLPENTLIPNLHEFHYDHEQQQQLFKKPMFTKPESFDLNFPPVFLNGNAPETTDLSIHNRFTYNDPTQISLQLWSNREDSKNTQSYQKDNNNGMHGLNSAEEQCKINLVKLSELKDVNFDGGSSRWLQMGIAPTTDIIAGP